MPLDKYFGGHGKKVMRSMRKTYSPKKAQQVFYATANKRKRKRQKGVPLRSLLGRR